MILGLLIALLAAVGPGYWWWLRSRRPHAEALSVGPSDVWPDVHVIVPVHNERAWIGGKIDDLLALAYPPDRLRFWIVDGASSDGTGSVASARTSGDERFTILSVPIADKTAQLNVALERIAAPWVMVTDADARLPRETLLRMVSAGQTDREIAAVGTPVAPARAHWLEQLHWAASNAMRRREGACGSASIVAGPCYLFRRSLVEAFPPDVVADDVHVAFAAAAAERRVAFVDAEVIELRSPLNLRQLLRHKIRKGDAYLREIFRFLPRAARMRPPARPIFLWRAAHILLMPAVAATALAAAIAVVAADPGGAGVAAGGAGLVLVAAARRRWPLLSRVGPLMLLFMVLAIALLAALARYPFSRQTACFPKVAVDSTSG